MKVAIIGAGVSGLASARRALEYNLNCVVFELADVIGGTWVYHEKIEADEFGVSMYSNIHASLRVNLPIQLMEFSDFPFEPESGLYYPDHKEVSKYLKDFAEKYNLYPCIKHKVQRISKEPTGWQVAVKNLLTDQIDVDYFDAVIVCNGHFAKPTIPYIPGIETFTGHKIHSYQYRNNNPFANKRVLIVGCGPSGTDVSIDCAKVADQVYLSRRNETKTIIIQDVTVKPDIFSINGDEVKFKDGSIIQIDCIVLCTGYEYHLPFLDPSCGVTVSENNQIIRPLYKKFINCRHPTMCFIGLLRNTLVFALVDLQAEVFVKHLTGEISLPSIESMLRLEEEEYTAALEAKMLPTKYFSMLEKLRPYLEDLAEFGHTATLSDLHFKIYGDFAKTHMIYFQNWKQQPFKILVDTNSFRIKNGQNEVSSAPENST